MPLPPRPALVLAALLHVGAPAPAQVAEAAPGGPVSAGFTDVRWLPRQLADFGSRKGFVLFFTALDCPLVERYLPRLQELALEFGPRGVQFLAVDSNAGDALVDAAAMVVERAPALAAAMDFDGSLAKACDVDRTACAVLLDGERRLVYRGRVDGQYRYTGVAPERGREDLREAIADLLAQTPVRVPRTEWEGCKFTFALPAQAPGRAPTFCKDVAPVLQRHCQECHRPGGDGPFALLGYRDAAARLETIAEVVAERRMPPWYGSARHGAFRNHRGLADAERAAVAAWAAAGGPEGDPAELPPPREFPDAAWRIGEPDLVLKVPVAIRIPAEGYVPYKYFALPFHFGHDTWVEAMEIRPNNHKALHHCNLVRVKLGEKFSQDGFVTGQVPGGDPMALDPGTAVRIPKGSSLVLQAHYVTTGRPEEDRLSVGLRFPRVKVQKELQVMIVADRRFEIPPGAPAHPVRAARRFDRDALGIGLFVHMHLRGRDMTVRALPPGGGTETLLLVPNYNFDWQQSYRWGREGLPFSAGTRIEALAHFDNSSFNPFNPDPARAVRFGLETVDEMMYAFLFWVAAAEDLGLAVDPATGRAL